jgi:methylmalonyl-CoA/ethylmalonyl-CoA epimerase
MRETETKRLPFSRIDQVGVIVKDMSKAIEYYEALGIGPFKPLNVIRTERKLYGKVVHDVKNIVMVAQMGQVELELVQPVSGESLQMEFLKRRGEGINHLCFFVDDLDKEVANLVNRGFKLMASLKYLGGGGTAWFDTDEVGGVLFELAQRSPQ